ncbi:MAG: glycoside hydrolase family 15 protein [Alphaproteobacteria bacterium]|nr:glycoside hydrolase family 15 protein [Alphaproteobacteria bacterium]
MAETRKNRIEDYALIGDLRTAALVGRDGSLDWLCLRRFDGAACFAALVGESENGRWLLAPKGAVRRTQRHYHENTLVLETEYETAEGKVAVIDFMPQAAGSNRTDVVRVVEGRGGKVAMQTEIVLRMEYGIVLPWVQRTDDGLIAIAGPDAVVIRTPVPLEGKNFRTSGTFTVAEGERVPFVMTSFDCLLDIPPAIDPLRQLEETESWWRNWVSQCTYRGEWREAVVRSLITLKALTHSATGGIVAAPTTSLPELIGGGRNWDYRFCWIRDATFTLYALLISGYREEARAWREWLSRAVAGAPSQLQPLYGVAGERRLTECELPWLCGYADSRPVRIGNDAASQVQLDVYGELMDAFHLARAHDIESEDHTWQVQRALLDFLESNWSKPDRGIWEMRGTPRHFTHSKVMAWVAMDRAVKAITRFGLDGPKDRWVALRDRIHADICRNGFDAERNTFVQCYGEPALDGALLMLPLVGFLPVDDARIAGTVEAIRNELVVDGFVRRYKTEDGTDGLTGDDGVFLPCSFWLADNLAMMNRNDEAKEMFERLLALRNDVGLLSEEYDPRAKRLLGNFPQAFSHIALINTAYNLSRSRAPKLRGSG